MPNYSKSEKRLLKKIDDIVQYYPFALQPHLDCCAVCKEKWNEILKCLIIANKEK